MHRPPLSQSVCFTPLFLPGAFARQGLFGPTLVARLQVEGVLLNVLDNVFLLDFSLKSPQGTLNRLTLLNLHFCQD